MGLASLVWFLARVIPKPTRATYPCQRVAAPLASAFVIWVAGIIGSTLAYRKARALYGQARYLLAGFAVAFAVLVIWLAVDVTGDREAAAFVPVDPPNTPMGVGKGIHPGRVVWVYEPGVTSWDGQTGDWWDDENTDQGLTDLMVSRGLRSLTGERSDAAAWNTLFRHFNRVHGYGEVGYKSGEKIAIKLNMNQDKDHTRAWQQGAGMPSPHVVHALLKQLVRIVGVRGRDIAVYDSSKYIGDPIYDKIRADPNPQFQNIRFVVVPWTAGNGREEARLDTEAFVQFADSSLPNGARAHLPDCVTEAKYLINMVLLRAHDSFGVTLSAKNHFGSLRFPDERWGPGPLHYRGNRTAPMGRYSCLVELIGSKHLGGKTLLYMLDALYPGADNSSNVIRFQSFGDDWCSSLFFSQDAVAIDSVGLDFLRHEPESLYVQRSQNLDNYLHEAALVSAPPSGTFYDPDGSGIRLASLGVHEHWDNPVDKRYSRNLGANKGIELVAVRLADQNYPMGAEQADLTNDGVVDAYDLAALMHAWLAVPGDPRWVPQYDLSVDNCIEFNDLACLSREWRWQAE